MKEILLNKKIKDILPTWNFQAIDEYCTSGDKKDKYNRGFHFSALMLTEVSNV